MLSLYIKAKLPKLLLSIIFVINNILKILEKYFIELIFLVHYIWKLLFCFFENQAFFAQQNTSRNYT